MLDTMVDTWEEVFWSEHVPNDSVLDVMGLVTQSAELFTREIGYILPPQYKGMFTQDSDKVEIELYPTHTTILIIEKGGAEW